MKITSLGCAAIGALLAAAPVLAQTAPPAPPAAPAAGKMMHGGMGGMGGMRGHGGMNPYASMSEAGRATMRDAMRAGGDRKAEREQVKAARDRMLVLLDAERLDSSALKRAMDDERNAANASRERHQAAMLAAFGKLSVADRKAFVADSRAMKARMEQRVQQWRGKRGAGMPTDDMPPPPPM
ncbi:MAG: periplasmic heavy metal sensor [Polymorphobacter sp.]